MEHDRNSNPYDDIDEYYEGEKKTLREIYQAGGADVTKRHTDAFKPENIREFAMHMDARSRGRKIMNVCIGAAADGIAAIFVYMFVDLNLTLEKYIFIYAVVMVVFALFINKERSKRSVIVYAAFIVICTLLGVVFAGTITKLCDDPGRLIFAYLPLVIQCVLGAVIYSRVGEFHEAWESYRPRTIR